MHMVLKIYFVLLVWWEYHGMRQSCVSMEGTAVNVPKRILDFIVMLTTPM